MVNLYRRYIFGRIGGNDVGDQNYPNYSAIG
jgi:hypothetical protein